MGVKEANEICKAYICEGVKGLRLFLESDIYTSDI